MTPRSTALAAFALSLSIASPSLGQGWCLMNCPPSEASVKTAFSDVVTKALGSTRYDIRTFQIVEHQDLESGGAKAHRVRFKAEIVFPDGYKTKCLDPNLERRGWSGFADCMNFATIVPPMKAGASRTMEENITFEKTSRGWVFQGKAY